MKKLIFLLIIIFISAPLLKADNIFLKNGTKFLNVKIKSQNNQWIFFEMSNGKKSKINKKAILKIENMPFNIQKESKIIAPKFHYNPPNIDIKKENYIYPNFKLIILSIISFTLSYDYLKQANDIQKIIDTNKKAQNLFPEYSNNFLIDSNNDLKNKKNRKIIIGSIFLTCGIINTIISFKSVKLNASSNGLNISYKF